MILTDASGHPHVPNSTQAPSARRGWPASDKAQSSLCGDSERGLDLGAVSLSLAALSLSHWLQTYVAVCVSASCTPGLDFLSPCPLTIPDTVQMNASFSQPPGCRPYTYCAPPRLAGPAAASPGRKSCSSLPTKPAAQCICLLTILSLPNRKPQRCQRATEEAPFVLAVRHSRGAGSRAAWLLNSPTLPASLLSFMCFNGAPRAAQGPVWGYLSLSTLSRLVPQLPTIEPLAP